MVFERKKIRIAIQAFLILLYFYIGLNILSSYSAVSTLSWMNIYRVSDFQTYAEVVNFYKSLLIPIPIHLSFLEFIEFFQFGTKSVIVGCFYRIGILLLFIPFIAQYRRNIALFFASIIFSLFSVFWFGVIHHGNPQLYDVFFPLFIIFAFQSYINLVSCTEKRKQIIWALFTGFFMSMAELSRSFFILIVFIFSIFFLFKYYKNNRSVIVFYLIPLVLFSGIWHIYIFCNHNQIVATNHSGFNMYRVWNSYIEEPQLMPEINNQPLVEGRWENLNTYEHLHNSNIISAKIAKYFIHNPVDSIEKIIKDYILFFWRPRTDIYSYKPSGILLNFYIWVIRGFMVFFFSLILFSGYKLFTVPLREWHSYISQPKIQIIIVILLSSLITTIGESGEEARFLLSIYPLLVYLLGITFPYSKMKENLE